MIKQICRKAFASLTLAVSVSITGAVTEAKAVSNDLVDGFASVSVEELGVQNSSGVSSTVDLELPYASPLLAQTTETAQIVDDTFAPLTEEELREQLRIDPNFVPGAPKPSPASGFLVPSAYGASQGDAFVGLSGITAGRTEDKWDGSASVGFGLGDPEKNVGLEVSLAIISLDGFAEDGSVGVKLHKTFPKAGNLGVALGWSNAIKWGAAGRAEDTFYGVATKAFDLRPGKENPLPLTTSLGVGTGSFRSLGAIEDGNNTPNLFGSLGLRIIPEVSVVSSWSGSSLGLGASAAPFDFPLVMTAGVSDVTDNTDSGSRFNGALGYSFSF